MIKQPSKIEGWIFPIEIAYMRSFASEQLPKNGLIVELGSYKGKSTVVWGCEALKKNAKVIAIDNHVASEGDKFTGYDFLKNVYLSELVDTVIPIFGDFDKVVKFFKAEIDILFIDGNHLYKSVKNDFLKWSPFIKKGGWIIFHDYNKQLPGVVKFCEELQLNNKDFAVDKRVGSLLFLKCVRGGKK